MENTLIEILNDYAKEYANGNSEVLPAIGRIMLKLEEMGYKVIATEK